MHNLGCEASPTANRDAAKALLKKLGFDNVARWSGVGVQTIFQWFSRATEVEPIPPARVAPIVNGARAEGIDVPLGVLMPPLAHLNATGDAVAADGAAVEKMQAL